MATSMPQCGSARATAGACGARAARWEQRGTSHQPHEWHGTGSLAKCRCERFYQRLVRGSDGNPRRGGCQNPWVQFSPNSRTSRSCRQNNVPYCSGQSSHSDFSVSAAPQFPRPLAFPLGESSRKRSSTAPARGQWAWGGTEPHRQFLALDSRGRKTSKSFEERTLHLNCQNCLPNVQETEEIFVE